MPDPVRLRPCPFCGGEAGACESEPIVELLTAYWVRCTLCGAATMDAINKATAHGYWNRRPRCPDCGERTPPGGGPHLREGGTLMNVNHNALTRRAYDLCLEVEKLPASEQATRLSVLASALLEAIEQQTPGDTTEPRYKVEDEP